ncbi:MAG: amidohydrolase family protein [Alphaproteobacteria bacterium]
MAKYDLVVRGGTVIDGTGGAPFDADVAVTDGKIAAVGKVADAGSEEIDAKGHLVTPGFIDIHTHFDAQVMWDQHLTPCSEHGVTTVLMGNCGVGFAPCKPEHRAVMVDVMDGVEDIPAAVLDKGLPWTWQSFPEFMDVLETRRADVDFGTFVPHVPIRVFVMGERGIRREPASPADIRQMAALVEEGIEAGGFGFTTSRATGHRARSGDVIPSTTADEDELLALALAMTRKGRGHFMSASEFNSVNGVSAEFNMLRRIAEISGRPVHFPMLQGSDAPDRWREIADGAAAAIKNGASMYGQVVPRPVGVLFGLEMTNNPFTTCPSYQAIASLPLAKRVAALRDPALRARLLDEDPANPDDRVVKMSRSADLLYRMGDPPNYSPPLSDRLDKIAESKGTTPLAVAYDVMMENDGNGVLYLPARNFAFNNLDTCLEMLRRPEMEIGLGDAGAHVGRICDSSMPTFLLTYWGRDRDGERLSLPWIVKALTGDHARVMGMPDRGILKTGLKADINVIDHDRLKLHAARATHDLPGGAMRLSQQAEGYVATVVSGVVSRRDGDWTGELPGRLVRAH